MTAEAEGNSGDVVATVELSIAGENLRLEMAAPAEPVRAAQMLPLFRALSETFVNLAVKKAHAEGLEVSCAKGCGACCRQMVPISKIEAHRLRDLVDAMPEPRRSDVVSRFEEVRRRMEEAGLLEQLRRPEEISDADYRAIGLRYFFQGAPCPFLEDESCSIHGERPMVCREYLVVSPAENCQRRSGEPVHVLSIPAEVGEAIKGLDPDNAPQTEGWIPLILALEWAEAHPPTEFPLHPGTEILRNLFEKLTGRSLPASADGPAKTPAG